MRLTDLNDTIDMTKKPKDPIEMRHQWLETFKEFVSLHADLSQDAWDAMVTTLTPLYLSRDDFFVRPENTNIQLGFIIKGLLRTYFVTQAGDEFITDFCSENDITTNYDVLTPGDASEYYSQAMEDGILLKIDYPAYEKLCKIYPGLETMKSNLISHHYARKISREKELLSLDATQKYERFIKDYAHIVPRVRQYHIASFLGITPVQLSRIKKGTNR